MAMHAMRRSFNVQHSHSALRPATTSTIEPIANSMVLRDLPPEIQSRIFEFCSPSDLTVLSRVHTSTRDMAEHTLYSHIQYRVGLHNLIPSGHIVEDEDSWDSQQLKEDRSLLYTFASNSRKASMVKTFHVELEDEFDESFGYEYHWRNRTQLILVKISEALAKMPNLVDLRILCSPWWELNAAKGTRRISEVIRFVLRGSGNDGD